MDDEIELIIPDCLDEPQDAIISDFSQVQIQVHSADVAEQILGTTSTEDTHVEYLEEEFDYEGIQEISDDPDDLEILPDRKVHCLINENGLDPNLGVTRKEDHNDDECVDITENIDTEDPTTGVAIETDNADETEIPNEFDDIERIPDKEISKYDAVIENYPDFYDVPIKEEIEPFMGTDYTNFDASSYHHEEEELPPEDIYHCNSRIILGTKPCPGVSSEQSNKEINHYEEIDIEQENLDAYVLLEDWDIKLKRSRSFCNNCNRLFATPNALMAHNTTEHSFLVPLNKNVAFKSTAKPAYARKNSGPLIVKDIHKGLARESTSKNISDSKICNHCNKVFTDVDMLNKHLYELLSKKFMCNICKVTFNTQKQLINHKATHIKREQLKTNRKIKKEKVEDTGFKKKLVYEEDLKRKSLKNKFEVIPEEDLKRKSVKNKFEVIPKSVLFHCRKCDVNLTTAFAGAMHGKVCKPDRERKNKISSAKTCQTCGKKISINGIMQHIKQHKICSKFKVYEITKNIHERVLCKCPKCHLHFKDCGMVSHLNACGTIPSALCFKCNILFPKSLLPKHSKLHVQQNVKPKDFIVVQHAIINLQEESPKKPTKRKLDMPELKLTKKIKLDFSHAFDNVETKNVPTPNIKIKKDPGFVDPDVKQKKNKLVSKLKFETKGNKVKLYHCTHCCRCVRYRLKPMSHIRKICTKSRQRTAICSLCGLQFGSKIIPAHLEMHKKRPLTIHDIEFHDIATLKRIIPKMPKYPQCESCKITFFDKNMIHDHICGEDYETCDVCNEKIHNSAFEVHTEFHDYVEARNPKPKSKTESKLIPEIMKKYKSLTTMWHIVFSCQKCEIVTDEYDKAVEHSQGHLDNRIVTKNIKCYICNLKFDETCWSKHSALHSQMNIDRKDFKVLSYNPKKLLTDEWFELFESLPEEQITQITNKSLYGFERRFEIKLLKEGRSEFTLYCCSVCKVCVRKNEIDKHVNGPCKNCGNICKICSVPFCDISTLKNHQILHMNGIKKDEFRVVLFTKISGNGSEQTPKLKAEVKMDKLKEKIEPNTASVEHNKLVDNRAKNKTAHYKCPKKGVKVTKNKIFQRSFTKFEPGADGKYLVYKCINCHSCAYRYDNIQSHSCDTEKYYCQTCKQYYPKSHNILSHRSTHFRRRDFGAKKIKIQTYDPSENEEQTEMKTKKNTNKKNRLDSTKNNVKIVVAPPKPTKVQNKTVKSNNLETNKANATAEATSATIYKCECGLHYTSLKTIEIHVQTCPDEEISKENCSKCGLLFPTDVLVSHLCKHHSEATLRSQRNTKFIVELYNHSESNFKSPELISKKGLESKFEHKGVPRKSSSSPQNNIESTKTQRNNLESPGISKTMERTANCEVKLYKCGSCNVHYLSQGACYGHIRNHKPVNFITCINCKHCNLQFTVNTLPTHVKRHHEDKSFDLSKVLIEEYQPRIGKTPPEIDLYIAADKVQSLHVSSSIDDAINDREIVVD